MTIDISAQPYYDDFDSSNGFHQILFKPGMSVQARELTQIQSILRDQISKFGGHIFKHGSVVLPGNSSSDLNVCYVKLAATSVDPTTLVGKEVIGSSTGLRGLIRYAVAQSTEPAKLYVSYYNTGSAGQSVFANGELLSVTGTTINFNVAASAAVGAASMAMINRGVFFVNGTFVEVAKQSIVIGDTNEPSAHVLLKIEESVVTSDLDESLLDPAQGVNNYAAPGADRLKITLTLTTLPLGSSFGSDYIEIMRFDTGVLLEHLRYAKYSELEKSLARRTYDESGDYVVNGLKTTSREHLKTELNGGRFVSGDSSKMIYTVSSGKAYVRGFEVETVAPVELTVDKARTASHVKTSSANMVPSFGQYLYVTDLVSLPNFLRRETINLYSAKTGGSIIGTANVVSIAYVESNTTDSNAIFKLYVTDVSFYTGGISDVGRFTHTNGSATVLQKLTVSPTSSTDFAANEIISAGTRASTVHKFTRANSSMYVFKHSPTTTSVVIGDTLTAPSTASGKVTSTEILGRNAIDNLLVPLPTYSTFKVKNESGVSDISYKIYYATTVNITSGSGSFSVTGMTIDPKSAGTFLITSAAGVHPLSTATVAGDGLSVTFAGITPSATTLSVICAATKTGSAGAPRTKTLVSSFTQSGLTPSSKVQLSMADVVRIRSIVSTIDGDVTSRYKLDSGQRDYAYLQGSLILTGNLPTGTLTVVYDYFNHNAGSGDYFSVDSYESSGMSDYYENTTLNYVSPSTGKSYDLRDVLDFRPRVGADGTYTGSGNSVVSVPMVDSRITTSIQQYVGRVDAIVLSSDGQLSVITGTPAFVPQAPVINTEYVYLAKVDVPPYTYSAKDVTVTAKNVNVFTMRDAGNLQNRVKNLEDLVLLSQAETSAVNYDVIDAKTGLSRYKAGYLVDSFNNADKISAINDEQFKVAYIADRIIPSFELINVPLTVTANSGQVTGDVVTLPYTNSVLAKQPMSSRVTNINPFSVFAWTGDMEITPNKDTWVVVEDLPVNYTSSVEYVTVSRPWRSSSWSGSSSSWNSWGSSFSESFSGSWGGESFSSSDRGGGTGGDSGD
jgi:hypothetical protein